MKRLNETFRKCALQVERMQGSVWSFVVVLSSIIGTGAYFRFSDRWINLVQLVITICTFLLLFFLQNSQNVSNKVTHLKLNELVLAIEGARNEVAGTEHKTEVEIDDLKQTVVDALKDEKGSG